MKYLKLYYMLVKMNIKVMVQYKADSIIGALSTLLVQVTSVIFIMTIFNNINSFAGWTYYEVMLVYGVFTLCRGLNHVFFDNLWIIGREFIRKGKFDLFLIRPANVLFQVVAQKIQVDGFGTLLIGLIITIASIKHLSIDVNALLVLKLMITAILGTTIIATVNLLVATSSFWVVMSNNIMWCIFSMADFAQYPLVILGKGLRFILTVIVPYGFVSYYPISYLLNKSGPSVLLYELIVVLVFGFIALKTWQFGIKSYESAGN